MCFQLQDAESWMGLDEKKKEKNPARPCITNWPQKHRCFWQRSVRPLLHHTLEVQGQQERGIPACFLPASSPFCKPTLASSHWFPNCSQMSVGHHGSALAPTQRLWNPGSHANTWICNIPFSDSFWTGRSHFNQDGQHLHSSLWKVFFKQKTILTSCCSSALPLMVQRSLNAHRPSLQAVNAPALSQTSTERGQCQQPAEMQAELNYANKYMHLENGVLKDSFTAQLTAAYLVALLLSIFPLSS